MEGLGGEEHLGVAQDLMEDKYAGCFCLTEMGHGSNVRGIRTVATREEDGSFTLNTPDFEV